jgi:CheY-like chemotaxis protein
MSELHIPYFKYPTQVICLDDDEIFLDSVKKYITTNNKIPIMKKDPIKAYNEFHNSSITYPKVDNFLNRITLEEEDNDDYSEIDTIGYQKIIDLIYEKSRFNEQAVFIVDYSMPIINGIDFCRKIKNMRAKKVILTGYDDYKLAVSALNHKIIDRYLVKDINQIREELNEVIDTMLWEYFCDFSNEIYPLNALHRNQDFINTFNKWLFENKIIEFYQCDSIGSYLGLNAQGTFFWFLLSNEEQINQYYVTAVNADYNSEFVNALRSKKNLIFLLSDEEKKKPISNWNKYMFPIKGSFKVNNEVFYYSTLTGENFSLDIDKVVTLESL